MRMPTDSSSQPAIAEFINPDNVLEVENWCNRFGDMTREQYSPLTRYCIGIYQIGQALGARDRKESIGACIIHVTIALTRVGAGICNGLPRLFSDLDVVFSHPSLLLAITKVSQQLFYRKYAFKNSYREKRINKKELEKYGISLIENVTGLIHSNCIAIGIAAAAEVLLKRAYTE